MMHPKEIAGTSSYRVLVLGDSFTWGANAGLGHSYVDVLEAGLHEHHDVVVWNAGIPATGTKQAVRSLRKLSPLLKPHLVILGFYRNDFNDNMYPLDMYIRRRDFKAIHMYTLDEEFNPVRLGRSRAFRRAIGIAPAADANWFSYALGRLRLYTLAHRPARKVVDKIRCIGGRCSPSAGEREREIEITGNLLREIGDFNRENGADVLVLLIPHLEDVSKGQPSDKYTTAMRLLNERDIPFVDPLMYLEPEDYIPPPNNHWNNRGHEKAGRQLLGRVLPMVREGISPAQSFAKPPAR